MIIKRIASEIAVGTVLIIAIMVGGIFWMQNKTNNQEYKVDQNTVEVPKAVESKIQTTDEFADWRTYKNDKFGFEIKYPQKYKANNGDEFNSFAPSFFINNPEKNEIDGPYYNYTFELNYSENFLRDEDGSAKNPEEWLAIQNEEDKYIEVTIDNKKAYLKTDSVDETEKEYILFIFNGKAYDLYQFIIRKDDIGEKILETIKFGNIEKDSPKEIVKNVIEKFSLDNNQASKYPSTYWKIEDRKVMCLNDNAHEYFIHSQGLTNTNSLINNIAINLKENGFTENKLNDGFNGESDQARVGLEKGNVKCTISKMLNERKSNTEENNYLISLSCGEMTNLDQQNFEIFYDLAKSDVVCIYQNDGNYFNGVIAGYDDSFGPMAGASYFGKRIKEEWKTIGTQEYPPCEFVDEFPDEIYSGMCLDNSNKERKSN